MESAHAHTPEWEEVKREELVPKALLGILPITLFSWCHGKPMRRTKTLITYKCKKCNIEKKEYSYETTALCTVCHHTEDVTISGDDNEL